MMIDTARGRASIAAFGSGPPRTVLLHPLALSGEVWSAVDSLSASAGSAFGIDVRGHGQTPWDGSQFSVEELADDVAALIHAAAGGPVNVVGMSMGGCVALALALGHPHLVSHLVLADTTASYGPDRLERWEERAHQAETTPRSEQLTFQVERWFTAGFRESCPEVVRAVCDIFVGTDSRAHAAACRALGAFDRSGDLGEVEAPTLVLVGEEDYATPVSMAEQLAEGIPGGRLHVLGGARHLSLLERADAWQAIGEHLSETK